MTAENFTNFGTTQMASPSVLSTSGTTFSVTGGQGALFPTSNFYVTIDTEVLFISSRATDTFTISGRGQDGSSIATHSSGATVQHCLVAANIRHIWENLADTYTPDAPPIQESQSPPSYDNEFESVGTWTLYPSSGLPSGASFGAHTLVYSYLTLNRGFNDNTLYTAYTSFTPGTSSFTITAKISDAVNFANNGQQTAEVHFFVSDQSNPTASADSGNRFRVDLITRADSVISYGVNNRYARILFDTNGTGKQYGSVLYVPISVPLWLRIVFNSSNNTWNGYVGDGYTFNNIGGSSMSFTPQSMGLQFYAGFVSNYVVTHTVSVDYVRSSIGTVALPFGL